MPVGHDEPGLVVSFATTYEVSRVKIAEFAEAIGDLNPLFRDREAARTAGYPDVIAPPTFAVVLSLPASIHVAAEALAGADHSRVVHVEQRFEWSRPIQAGDALRPESAVTAIREVRGHLVVSTRTTIRSAGGQHVCTAYHTLVHRPANGH
jgi:acyl dehydratase